MPDMALLNKHQPHTGNKMFQTRLSAKTHATIGALGCALSIGSVSAQPVPALLIDDILADFPAGSYMGGRRNHLSATLSDNGRFMLFFSTVRTPSGSFESDPSTSVSFFIDLYSGERENLDATYPSLNGAKSMSASGRYVTSNDAIVDVKTGTVTSDFSNVNDMNATAPLRNSTENITNIISDSGRYISYAFLSDNCLTSNGYIYDQLTRQSTLATPNLGTTNQPVCADNQTVTGALISGNGRRFFWGSDGDESDLTSRWGLGSRNTRDVFAHDLHIGSTTNTRVSNCNECGNTSSVADTTLGSHAYENDISADGRFAVFKSFHDYGFGQNNTGMSIYLRNLDTLEVELISEPFGTGPAETYQYPSISSDGRFVVFSTSTATYIRDQNGSEQALLDGDANDVMISGDGKTILLERADGWYTMANPYLSTQSNFASNYLFVSLPNSENQWSQFAHMNLVDEHTWVGYIEFESQNDNAFKFDVGGQWNAQGNVVTSSNWSENYGDNNSDGTADLGGTNIQATQGAGKYKISFYDDTKHYAVEKLVDVQFSCHNATTTLGQSTYVVGNIDELGNWSVANAIKLNPTAYPTWTGSIALPSPVNVEWKCIKRNELDATASVQWQSGGNNSFNTSSTQNVQGNF